MPSAGALKAGRAVIELGLDSEGVRTGLDTLQAKLKSVGQSMQVIGKQMAIVGGAVTGFVGLAVKNFTDLGSELVDVSNRTGLTVESLSALKFAAEQSGSSLGDLERGIRFLQKSGGDASIGGLMRIADELQGITDPAMRAQRAMELFGRQAGPQLIPLLAQGSQGLQQLMQAAADTGNVMSTDAATAAEQLGDAIDALKTQFMTLMVQIATAVAGDLQTFIDRTIQITTGIIHWMQQHQALIRVVAISGAALLALGTTMIVLGKAFVAVSVAIKGVHYALNVLSKNPWLIVVTFGVVAIGEMTGAFDALARKIDEVAGVTKSFADGNKALLKDLDRLKIEAMEVSEEMDKIEDVKIPEIEPIEIDIRRGVQEKFDEIKTDTSAARSQPRVESLFDTRLAKQVFGFADASRIERDQLNVLKKIDKGIEKLQQGGGIPVI
jgi:hypothetical protein